MPYVGEIRMFGGNFAPVGWAFCDGRELQIVDHEDLWFLIGTTYGGDGQQTFNLPDLRGRAPVHMGTGPAGITYQIGERAGVESVTLTPQQVPVHSHSWVASTGAGTSNSPEQNVVASPPVARLYRLGTPSDLMSPTIVQPAGGSQPHENRQPFLAISFIIALFGVFPNPT